MIEIDEVPVGVLGRVVEIHHGFERNTDDQVKVLSLGLDQCRNLRVVRDDVRARAAWQAKDGQRYQDYDKSRRKGSVISGRHSRL